MNNNLEIKAKAKYLPISAKKLRAVFTPIAGMDVEKALNYLDFLSKRAARPVKKLLNSAIANAQHNFNLPKEFLVIKKITADEGPTQKSWRPRAMGRAETIRKRSSHLNIVLSVKEGMEGKITPKTIVSKIDKIDAQNKPLKSKKKPIAYLGAKKEKTKKEEVPQEIFDIHRQGKHRSKSGLDKIRRKEKGGATKHFFRQKAI